MIKKLDWEAESKQSTCQPVYGPRIPPHRPSGGCPPPSFLPDDVNRVHPGGAQRGDEAGDEADAEDYTTRDAERPRIVRFDPEKQAGNRLTQAQSHTEADHRSDGDDPEAGLQLPGIGPAG